jgi:hypothetical protein
MSIAGTLAAGGGPEAALAGELKTWAEAGLRPRLWLRDDDAVTDSPALRQLIDWAAGWQIPLALAVIPRAADESLVEFVFKQNCLTVLVHGWAHQDHEARPMKKTELGTGRALAAVVADVAAGIARIGELFGERMLPVLVPPWNRVREDLVPILGDLGYMGISTFGGRRFPGAGLIEANAHIDIMDWRERRGRLLPALISELVRELKGRREAGMPGEPVGVLTHHAVHDDRAQESLAKLAGLLDGHVDWLSAGEVFDGH